MERYKDGVPPEAVEALADKLAGAIVTAEGHRHE